MRAALFVALAASAFADAPAAPDAAEIEARVRLEVAERFAAEGRTADAIRELDALLAKVPGAPSAARARSRREELLITEAAGVHTRERARRASGRWELVFGDSLLGVGYGELVAGVATGFDAGAATIIWSGVGGGTAGIVLSTGFTQDRFVGEGYAHLHVDAQIIGLWHGVAIGAAQDVDSNRAFSGLLLGGGLLGLATSLAAHDAFDMPRGEAETITSGWAWGSWIGIAGALLAHRHPGAASAAALLYPTLAAGDAGLVLGAIAAPRLRLSRWHVRFIDLGGVLGAVFGGALLATFDRDNPSTRAVVGAFLSGTLAGAATAAFLTRTMESGDGEACNAPPALVRIDDGRVTWGVPLPRPVVTSANDGTLRMGGVADVVAGRF